MTSEVGIPGDSDGEEFAAMWGAWIRSLVWEDLLEKGTATHSSILGAALVAQTVENLCAVQENQVPSLGQEDPVKKGMAAHSSILAWRIPWTEVPGGLQCMVSQRVRHD